MASYYYYYFGSIFRVCAEPVQSILGQCISWLLRVCIILILAKFLIPLWRASSILTLPFFFRLWRVCTIVIFPEFFSSSGAPMLLWFWLDVIRVCVEPVLLCFQFNLLDDLDFYTLPSDLYYFDIGNIVFHVCVGSVPVYIIVILTLFFSHAAAVTYHA